MDTVSRHISIANNEFKDPKYRATDPTKLVDQTEYAITQRPATTATAPSTGVLDRMTEQILSEVRGR